MSSLCKHTHNIPSWLPIALAFKGMSYKYIYMHTPFPIITSVAIFSCANMHPLSFLPSHHILVHHHSLCNFSLQSFLMPAYPVYQVAFKINVRVLSETIFM